MLLKSEVYETIQNLWKNETLIGLQDFIRLPALSRSFDPDWESNGILKQTLLMAMEWGKKQLPQATFEILESPKIPPALKIYIPAFQNHNGQPAFLYGHLDKQPEAGEWAKGLGPWQPVIKENLLYGRGSVDDGYNFFLCLTAIKALEEHESLTQKFSPFLKQMKSLVQETSRPTSTIWHQKLVPLPSLLSRILML